MASLLHSSNRVELVPLITYGLLVYVESSDQIEITEYYVVQVTQITDAWTWANDALLPNLYATKLYDGSDVHWRQKYFLSDLHYFRVGIPRIRLARGKPGRPFP